MTKRLLMLALMTGCGTDDAPSCQTAIDNYYAAGCVYSDSSGAVIARDKVVSNCQTVAIETSSACLEKVDVWLTCINRITSPASDGLCGSCNTEQMNVLTCH